MVISNSYVKLPEGIQNLIDYNYIPMADEVFQPGLAQRVSS